MRSLGLGRSALTVKQTLWFRTTEERISSFFVDQEFGGNVPRLIGALPELVLKVSVVIRGQFPEGSLRCACLVASSGWREVSAAYLRTLLKGTVMPEGGRLGAPGAFMSWLWKPHGAFCSLTNEPCLKWKEHAISCRRWSFLGAILDWSP